MIESISISGPISIYGGDVYTDSDVTISGEGVTFKIDILRLGANDSNAIISTGSDPITLKSDWIAFDGSGTTAGTGETRYRQLCRKLNPILPPRANFSVGRMVQVVAAKLGRNSY